jgi:hypothetical protein
MAGRHPAREAARNRQSSIVNDPGGQGRVRTSVGHMGRQIYSLLLLTAQPPVRIPKTKAAQRPFASERLHLPADRLPDRHAAAPALPHQQLQFYPEPGRTHALSRSVAPSRGAGEGIRTPDPLITNQMLYQLSYASRPKPPNYMKQENKLQEALLHRQGLEFRCRSPRGRPEGGFSFSFRAEPSEFQAARSSRQIHGQTSIDNVLSVV